MKAGVISDSVKPLPFDPSFEQVPDDEAQTSEELAKALHSIMETTFKDNGHATRSVHAKAHGLSSRSLALRAHVCRAVKGR